MPFSQRWCTGGVCRHETTAAGIDNLLDGAYAEHISRGGSAISGFVQMTRVNEPGLTLWPKSTPC